MKLDGIYEEDIDAFLKNKAIKQRITTTQVALTTTVEPAAGAPSVSDEPSVSAKNTKTALSELETTPAEEVTPYDDEFAYLYDDSVVAPVWPQPCEMTAEIREKFQRIRGIYSEGQVRESMRLEGLSQTDIDAFFNGSPTV